MQWIALKQLYKSLLASVDDVTQPQQKFLLTLFSTLLISYGRATFTNLGRYSQLNERTYRRQYQRSFNKSIGHGEETSPSLDFNFIKFNQQVIEQAIEPKAEVILAVDCSFIPKSGKQTYGLDYFYTLNLAKWDAVQQYAKRYAKALALKD